MQVQPTRMPIKHLPHKLITTAAMPWGCCCLQNSHQSPCPPPPSINGSEGSVSKHNTCTASVSMCWILKPRCPRAPPFVPMNPRQ